MNILERANKAIKAFFTKSDTVTELDPFIMAQYAGFFGYGGNAYSCVPAVKTAIDFVTRNAAQLEIGFYDFKTNKEVFKENINAAKIISLFKNPSPSMDEKGFCEAIVGYLIYRGEAIIAIENTWGSAAKVQGAIPVSLRVLNPAACVHYCDANGDIINWSYKGKIYPASEIIHIKVFNPDDDTRGLDPQRALEDLLKTSIYSTKASAKFYENGALPEFILTTDQKLSQAEVDAIKTGWEAAHKGVANKHKVAVATGGLKAQQLAQGTNDAQIAETKLTDERLYTFYSAQKALLNMTDTTNYATFQGQVKVFWQMTVMPNLTKVQAALNQRIVSLYNPNLELRFKYDNVPAFAEDFKDKLAQAKDLQALGFPLNAINDRLNLGMDPVDWGNDWWITFGLMPASDYGKAFDAPTATDDSNKSFAKQTPEQSRAVVVWKRFDITQSKAERLIAQRMGRFLSEQKARIAKILNDGGTVDWVDEQKRLETALKPVILDGVKEGIRLGKLQIPTKAANDEAAAARYISKVATRIGKISETTRNKVSVAVSEGLAAGSTINEIVDTFGSIFDKTRARMIARTEATGSINGGTAEYFAELGAKKQWLTTMDGNERESHAALNGETRNAGEAFSNGLQYPADPEAKEAGEVVNCRCTLVGKI